MGDEPEVIEGGYKGFWARIKGQHLAWYVLLLLGFGAMFVANVYALGESLAGHEKIVSRLDNQTCVLSLSDDQRIQMRTELGEIARVGGDVQRHMRINWCPWMFNGGSHR